MPSPTQKVGIKVNHQRMESARFAVHGMFCKAKRATGKIPPTMK